MRLPRFARNDSKNIYEIPAPAARNYGRKNRDNKIKTQCNRFFKNIFQN